MTLTQLNKLIERLEAMAIKAGRSKQEAQNLAANCIDNAAGVGGVEVNIECAVNTMWMYLDA
jgi:hypothetical protein